MNIWILAAGGIGFVAGGASVVYLFVRWLDKKIENARK